MLKVRCNTTDILCCMLGEMWKQQQLKAVCGTQPVFHCYIFFFFLPADGIFAALPATLTYCSYPFLSLAPSESFFLCVEELSQITYATFLPMHHFCPFFALSLHFLCIFFALCAGWLLVDSVSLFMHVLNDSEWMRMACLLNRSVSEPKLEWEWLSNVGITHFEGDFTFDLFFFFFYLVAAYLPSRLISNEASRWIVSHKASICWV